LDSVDGEFSAKNNRVEKIEKINSLSAMEESSELGGENLLYFLAPHRGRASGSVRIWMKERSILNGKIDLVELM